ncbi:conjugal transfer protein TraG (plasmid) [Halobacillus litoralis]|uniref:Conjugal transfer protein TraG n=2 Tax=Halobacillus litoralis TaxID=45668 RepID=A0A410MJI0_9BACI|nr:conjugal transfer protein TraG [Halobacillus litoralis]
MVGQFLESIPVIKIFGSPLKPSLLGLVIITVVSISTWLISTKVKWLHPITYRVIIFFHMFLGISFYYTWFLTAPVYNHIVPYFGERVEEVEVANVWHEILIGNPGNLMILFVFVPTIVIALFMIWLGSQYAQHNIEIKDVFREFEYKNRLLQRFYKIEDEEKLPDVDLGPDSETKELITQPGKDRTLNNVIIGSIGTGKTAALVLPILNQDLHWMTRFINDYSRVSRDDNFESEEVRGRYLNGISVIEPSNDLCQKTYKLVQAHKIPEESVFYIDPTNPSTPNINPMQGPVDQVAEAFAMVIEGLAEGDGGNYFFQQSERNHLKHYVYLLKLHQPDQEVTFDMLLDMYNNPQLVRRMHVQLKETFPDSIDDIEDRDERNHWKIVQQVDEWFEMNLVPKKERNGTPEKIVEGEYRGDTAYYDAKSEFVQGLRNILNDIGANKLIRRVLFGKSKFDFDRHLSLGGVLLVNTAKGELGNLANVLGKLILLSLQNAVFRREPNVSSFHHILVDEFPDYIYRPFKEFPAQSRKYKTIVTVVAQTVSQLADKYGETYMHTLLGTLRHKMVYGDIPDYDAQLFSAIFGEMERFEEQQSEQNVSPLQESPVTRSGSSYTKTKEAILSPSDIIFQKQFQAAVKIVQNNRPIPVRQIDANFVPRDEFTEAVITVDGESGSYWLEDRYSTTQEDSRVIDITAEEFMEETGEEGEDIALRVAEAENMDEKSIDLEPHSDLPPGKVVYNSSQSRLRSSHMSHNENVLENRNVERYGYPAVRRKENLNEADDKQVFAPEYLDGSNDTSSIEIKSEEMDTTEEDKDPSVEDLQGQREDESTASASRDEITSVDNALIDEDPLNDIFGAGGSFPPQEVEQSELSVKEEQLVNEIECMVKETDAEDESGSEQEEYTNSQPMNQNDLNSLLKDFEEEK